jgi:hypothetical protein
MQRIAGLPAALRFVLAFLMILAVQAIGAHLFPSHHADALMAGAPLLLSQIRSFGKTYQWLREAIQPVSADQPESFPDVLFDTQTYAQAGSALLTFFNSTAANLADATLSNFPTGQLPKGEFFEVHRIFTMIHSVPAAVATVAVTGPANDVEILHKTARGNLSWSMSNKPYGAIPLFFFGRPGGPNVGYSAYGTGTAANNSISFAQTAENGGFPVLGNQIIPEQQQFLARLAFSPTAISAATNIVVALLGVHHRQVR